jgi:hypothetical protein
MTNLLAMQSLSIGGQDRYSWRIATAGIASIRLRSYLQAGAIASRSWILTPSDWLVFNRALNQIKGSSTHH